MIAPRNQPGLINDYRELIELFIKYYDEIEMGDHTTMACGILLDIERLRPGYYQGVYFEPLGIEELKVKMRTYIYLISSQKKYAEIYRWSFPFWRKYIDVGDGYDNKI